MPLWQADWRFNNCMTSKHGCVGTQHVHAESEESARSQIRDAVSKKLFGTTAMQYYVDIERIKKVEGGDRYG